MRLRCGVLSAALWIMGSGAGFAQTVKVPGNYSSIQAAINAVVNGSAPNGSTIEVQAGTYAEALLINTTSKSLTLRGVSGPAATIVNASGKSTSALRILKASGAIRVEGLAFRGGTGVPGIGGGFTLEDSSPALVNVVFENNTGYDAGGGVMSRSNPLFRDCFIRNNTAARFGGGVVISTGSRPIFTNCQIRDNISGTGGAGAGNIGSGGGVHVNDASPTFRGCLITGNQSKFAAGGILHMGIFGSAYGPAILVLEDTEVSSNISSRYSAADNPAEGGGVHVEDNAVGYLIRSRIANNTANTSGGLSSYRARYEITSSTIEGNHAQDSQGVGGFGGGIGISSNNVSMPLRQAASLLMIDSAVRSNDARSGAGIFATGDQMCGSTTPSCNPASATRATVQIADSLIDGNQAGFQAGGLRLDRVDLTITNSHIIRNTVTASGSSFGGGMLMALGSRASLTGVTIAANSAVDFGGGLFIDDGAVLNMAQSRIYRNSATSGGGLYVGNNGPPSGTIQSSIVSDNSHYQIHEQACAPLQRTILTYQNNVIAPSTGQSDLFFSTCGGGTSSISAFNSLPSGRASGNISAPTNFSSFLASPKVGSTVLSWVVSHVSSVTIAGLGNFSGDTGSTVATPATSTTFTLTAAGGVSAAASVTASQIWGAADDVSVAGDFDGDGRADLAVYRPATGQWFIARSTAGFLQVAWGAPALGDIPAPADYDGDGKTDVAVFRMATGQWIILNSSNGTSTVVAWGAPGLGDRPVAADYDGDGKADIAVYRQTTGDWLVRLSRGGSWQVRWGAPSLGDIPVAADYDGDGRADVAVYRATTGQWFISQSTGGPITVTWGAPSFGDLPVPADYDGDGKTDLAVVRQLSGDWYVRGSRGTMTVTRSGVGDGQAPGDFNGNGRAEIAIWRAATGSWLILP